MVKIWVDDIRPAPAGYMHCKTTESAIDLIKTVKAENVKILDLDHDAGDYAPFGGDYINILNWLEYHDINIPISIHSMNPVGRNRMLSIIKRNNWTYIQ